MSTTGAIKEETPGLAGDAKVDPAQARQAALAKVPGGKIVKEELERENGKLVYSFDIKKGTEPGIEEVLVNALDGAVVSVVHENATMEAAEARQEGAQNPRQ
ncbi:MAG: PepSY domain-containing protein [Gemmatimonadales bacterium]